MSICSHPYRKDCPGCQITAEDLMEDPVWAEKVAEAEAAGRCKCHNCDFEYFKTTDTCPLCNTKRNPLYKQAFRKIVDFFSK